MNRDTNISEEEFNTIERYVLNNMSQEEGAVFTSRLATDTTLQSKADEVKLLLLGVKEAVLQEKLDAFHTELSETNIRRTKGRISSMRRWLVAASVILFAAIGAWVFLNNSSKEEKIFSQYYKPDPGLISAMNISDNYLFDKAMIDYKTGNYDSAIKAWEGLLTAKPGNDTLNYFLGSSYLARQKSNKAIKHFEKVIAVSNSYFLNDAHWYMGLALLKEGKTKEAIPFIENADRLEKNGLLLRLRSVK